MVAYSSSHHLMNYAHGPPVPLSQIHPSIGQIGKRAAHFLTGFVNRQNGHDSTAGNLAEIPEHLVRYAILQNLYMGARRLMSTSAAHNSTAPTAKRSSIDEFVIAAAEHAKSPDEMFLLGAYAFPELDPQIQMRVVARFALEFAHCWRGSTTFNGPQSYVSALENHMDRRAWIIGVDTGGGEDANRRRMLSEIASGIRMIYQNPAKLADLRQNTV